MAYDLILMSFHKVQYCSVTGVKLGRNKGIPKADEMLKHLCCLYFKQHPILSMTIHVLAHN